MTADEFIAQFLKMLRGQFYADRPAKQFFQQEALLKRALTLLAKHLAGRGVFISEPRYREITHEIIQGIKRHGDTGKIHFFSGYFLKVVQEHIAHHGDKYYEEGKSVRDAIESGLELTGRAKAKARAESARKAQQFTANLSQVHAALKPAGARKKQRCKASASAQQSQF